VLSLLLVILIGFGIYSKGVWLIFGVLTVATGLVIVFAGKRREGNRIFRMLDRLCGSFKGYAEKRIGKEEIDTG